MKTRKINIKFENAKELIRIYIVDPFNINWGAEIKIANKLLKHFPDINFWRRISVNYQKVASLKFFLNDLTFHRLVSFYEDHKLWLAGEFLNKKTAINLDSEPLIKINTIKQKPRNIIEFVDNAM